MNTGGTGGMLTVKQAAAALGMSKTNVIARLHRGTIRGEKAAAPTPAGYYWVVPESEVERLRGEGK